MRKPINTYDFSVALQKKGSSSLFFLLLLAIILPYQTFASMPAKDLEDTILVLNRARTNGVKQLSTDDFINNSTQTEKEEFQKFLHYLGGRIFTYCEDLKNNYPNTNMEGLPCMFEESGSLLNEPPKELPPIPESKTAEEEINEFDKSLNAALGDFDAMLLKENEKLESERAAQSERQAHSEANGSGSQGNSDNKAKSGTGSYNPKDSKQEQQSSPQKGHQGASSSKSVGGSDNSNSTKDNSKQKNMEIDDDIVARQLREAAEKETDPEIKEKLWEEYYKYKEGGR